MVARIVKLLVAILCTWPLNKPVELRVRPTGSAPAATDQVIVGSPVAMNWVETVVPVTSGDAGQADVITGGVTGGAAALIVTEHGRLAVCCGLPESAACTVKLEPPAAVGVPESTPEALSVKPAGRAPAMTE